MNFKERLKLLLLKYPFIHIDQVGELSIVVPLTGTRRVTDNFGNSAAKPISLFLFGDNTCKADLERRKFFFGTEENGHYDTFTYQFPQLIQELTELNADSDLTPDDRKLLQTLMSNLQQSQEKAMVFSRNNPGQEVMKNDFLFGDEIFLVKGEFIVNTYQDPIRTLDLPNIATLTNSKVQSQKKLIPIELRGECLDALSQIKKPLRVDKIALIDEFIKAMAIEDLRSHFNSKEPGKSPAVLFEKIYEEIRRRVKPLAKLDFSVFKVMESNWNYLEYDDDWTKEDIINNARLLFRQANIVTLEEEGQFKSFESIYQLCMNQFAEQYPERDDSRLSRETTYQLFILQTFLYLCAIELRLKNKEYAKSFLKIFEDKCSLENIITKLCTNEKAFIKMMQDEFQLSLEEYHSIVDITHSLYVDHLEAEHFDELRLGCAADVISNTHYIIMGGCLYWSTVPITETSAINSQRQQKQVCASHFEIFYDRREHYVKNAQAFVLITNLLEERFDENVKQTILLNLPYLTTDQKNELLLAILKHKDYEKVQFLIEHSAQDLYPYAFLSVMKQRPIDLHLMNTFLRQNANYAQYVEGSDLLFAAQHGALELLKLILHYRPDLLEYTDNLKQTALLGACITRQVAVVEYLMAAGANIHARTMIPVEYQYKEKYASWPARTARQWVEHLDSDNAAKIVALFDNYYEFMEHKFQVDPEYKNNFNAAHLTTAINNGDLKLIDIYIKYCPDLLSQYKEEDKARAIKQYAQRELLEQVTPCHEKFRIILSMLQRKAVELEQASSEDDRKAVNCIDLLNKELAKAANKFFFHELTPESLHAFQGECTRAIKKATPTLAEHRGWFEYSRVIRVILGIVATLTVIPALVVLVASPTRYTDTFFASKDYIQTDSIKKLNQFEDEFTVMHSELANKLSFG